VPLEERQHVAALELPPDNHIALRVNAMNLENRLCDVETDCRDRLHLRSSESGHPIGTLALTYR
jgi:hypothetical protein